MKRNINQNIFFWGIVTAIYAGFSYTAIYSQETGADGKYTASSKEYHHSSHVHHHQKITSDNKQNIPYLPAEHLKVMDHLEREGLHFSMNYVANTGGNPIGGERRGYAYAGSMGMFFNADLEKIAKLSGVDFFFTATWRKGNSLSRKIGNTFGAFQVYGSETLQMANAAFKITALKGDFIWYVGRISPGDIFLQSPYYSYFVNNGINGNPEGILLNMPFYVYPNSVWGTALDVKNKYIEVKAGVYNTNPKVLMSKYHGLNFSFNSPFGALLISEICFLVGQSSASNYSGHYKVGVAYTTGRQEKIVEGEINGNFNYYFLMDQTLFQNDYKRIGTFLSLIAANSSCNTFPFFLNGGFTMKGLFVSRPNDVTSLGVVHGKYSKYVRQVNKAQGQPLQHAESVIECNHMVYLSPNQSIQPSLQYIIHPSGKRDIPNAFVIATQVSLAF